MSFCERYGELIVWLPLGILSLLTFRWFPTPDATQPPHVASTANGTNAGGSMQPLGLDYALVENATMANARGQSSRVLRYAAREQQADGSFASLPTLKWAQYLSDDENANGYIEQFMNLLGEVPMDAYFFETKGITYSTANDASFEFVLVESSYLYRFADAAQDADTFGDKFEQCAGSQIGCAFSNPRGDSILIAPMQLDGTDGTTYGHLAAFARRAPKDQKMQFWKLVMQTYMERMRSEDPNAVWLSTDGTGVAWLHVRLDPRPKYYDYKPYAEGA